MASICGSAPTAAPGRTLRAAPPRLAAARAPPRRPSLSFSGVSSASPKWSKSPAPNAALSARSGDVSVRARISTSAYVDAAALRRRSHRRSSMGSPSTSVARASSSASRASAGTAAIAGGNSSPAGVAIRPIACARCSPYGADSRSLRGGESTGPSSFPFPKIRIFDRRAGERAARRRPAPAARATRPSPRAPTRAPAGGRGVSARAVGAGGARRERASISSRSSSAHWSATNATRSTAPRLIWPCAAADTPASLAPAARASSVQPRLGTWGTAASRMRFCSRSLADVDSAATHRRPSATRRRA